QEAGKGLIANVRDTAKDYGQTARGFVNDNAGDWLSAAAEQGDNAVPAKGDATVWCCAIDAPRTHSGRQFYHATRPRGSAGGGIRAGTFRCGGEENARIDKQCTA